MRKKREHIESAVDGIGECWCETICMHESPKGNLYVHRYLERQPDGSWRFTLPPDEFIKQAIYEIEYGSSE